MLFVEYSSRQRLDRVVFMNRDRVLHNYRAVIEMFVDQVNCAAADFDSVLQRLPLRVQSGERGQKGRMDVKYSMPKCVYEQGADQSHIACQTNKRDAAPAELDYQFSIVFFARPTLVTDKESLDSALAGFRQAGR